MKTKIKFILLMLLFLSSSAEAKALMSLTTLNLIDLENFVRIDPNAPAKEQKEMQMNGLDFFARNYLSPFFYVPTGKLNPCFGYRLPKRVMVKVGGVKPCFDWMDGLSPDGTYILVTDNTAGHWTNLYYNEETEQYEILGFSGEGWAWVVDYFADDYGSGLTIKCYYFPPGEDYYSFIGYAFNVQITGHCVYDFLEKDVNGSIYTGWKYGWAMVTPAPDRRRWR